MITVENKPLIEWLSQKPTWTIAKEIYQKNRNRFHKLRYREADQFLFRGGEDSAYIALIESIMIARMKEINRQQADVTEERALIVINKWLFRVAGFDTYKVKHYNPSYLMFNFKRINPS